MAREIELKLTIPPEQFPALHRHPLIAQAPAAQSAVTLINTYFDTPKLKLHRRNIALRLRKAGRRQLQTVKVGAESAGGLSSRSEWEQIQDGGHFDFAAIDRQKIRRVLEKSEDKLQPVFTITVRREIRRLQPRPGCSVLIMLDRGKVAAGERSEPLAEVELELETGTARDLFELALQLSDGLTLRAEDESKGERGYRLYAGSPRYATHADPSPITSQQDALLAFCALASDGLRMWQANAAGLQQPDSTEFVHQFRIAVRRLRTLLRVFSPALPQSFIQRWAAEFKAFAQHIGEARDVNVLQDAILQPALGEEHAENPSELLRMAHRVGDATREAALQWLSSSERVRLPLEFARDLDALEQSSPSPGIERFSADALKRLRRKARQRLKTARGERSSDSSLHRLRIALKRLRYALDFFAPLLPSKFLASSTKALGKAQGDLGYLNDIAVAGRKFEQWEKENAHLGVEADAVIDWHRSRASKIRRKVLSRVDEILYARMA